MTNYTKVVLKLCIKVKIHLNLNKHNESVLYVINIFKQM